MLKIEHTICPSCSVGCGLNIISKNDELVGTHPYKNHEINEGRNCNNCINFVDNFKSNKISQNIDYEEQITKFIEESKNLENKLIITSGLTDDVDLNKIIDFSNNNNFELATYEYNFTRIDTELLVNYNEIDKSKSILIIGDIYRENPLIARRIVHSKKNGSKTININTEQSLTTYNCDKFVQIDSFNDLINQIASLNLESDTVIIINKINSPQVFNQLLDLVKEKNYKILPVLKHANSFSSIEKIEPSTIDELTAKISEADEVVLINENPLEYLSEDVFKDKKLIVLSAVNNQINELADMIIPIRAWYEKEGSFTNAEGLTQDFKDTINDSQNELKTISEVLADIENHYN
ncbi:MAG: hypothetical protein E7Z84_03485 [Methanosphaera stadtmanae]|jgi:formate dehydrogenase major subunit|nr:hypothetical protein [Methanosphaera stadtmanae]